MVRVFTVQTQNGFWGKARTLAEAAKNCREQGGKKSDKVWANIFVIENLPEFQHWVSLQGVPVEAFTEDIQQAAMHEHCGISAGGGTMFPQGATYANIIDWHNRVTLGALIGSY